MLGETLGSYTILERLGQGAMGEVYLGEHRHLKRRVAIKMLARELMSRPELLDRFFMEARATSVIAHPGIVQIFDCEVNAEGRPYIVMEYLTGETLGKELLRRQSPLPTQRAARLARGIAEALQAAHDKGIIHRDLKPDNVFVSLEPAANVKVVDFGIAKLVGELRAASAHQTHSGAIMGTPLYMSPEQCRGSGEVDYRTDIYSLGCVFFEMLTGRPPFLEEGMGELIVAHLKSDPPEVQRLNPSVPDALAALVRQLLKKDPLNRPENMREVAERLSACITPGGTFPPSSGETPARPRPGAPTAITTIGGLAGEVKGEADEVIRPPRSRAPLVVVGAVALLLVGGGAYLAFGRGAGGASATGGTSGTVAASGPAETRTPPAEVKGTEASPAATGEQAPPPAKPVTGDEGAKGTLAKSELGKSDENEREKRPSSGEKESGEGATSAKTPGKASGKGKGGRLVAAAGESRGSADERGKTSGTDKAGDNPGERPVPGNGETEGAGKAAARPLEGTWEGPWTDSGANQEGRLYLVIQSGGEAAGWLNNKGANRSYRVLGRVSERGQVDLACQCPAAEMFTVRGSLKLDGDFLEGPLSLWSGGRAFGHPRVNIRRGSAP